MKITKEQIKEIIKEEFSTLEEGGLRFNVRELQDLLLDVTGNRVIINNGALVVYEAFADADGNLQLSVEPRR